MNLVRYENGSAICAASYTLNLVTPMAVHGANNKQTAQFRISSLKGIVRYWWRTLQFEKEKQAMLKEEESLFGGTNVGRKSPVTFFMDQPVTSTVRRSVLPHKNTVKVPIIGENRSITFTMAVAQHRLEVLEEYKKYVNYTLLLASIGQRARRGFGSVQWQEHRHASIDEYKTALYSALDDLHVTYDRKSGQSCLLQTGTAGLPTKKMSKHPTLAAVWSGVQEKNALEVLKKIGHASHIANRYGRLGSAKGGRFASPLWCTVRKMGDRYYPIVSELQSQSIHPWQQYERDRNEFLRVLGVDV